MWFTRQAAGFRGWFHVRQSTGALRTGLLAGDFTVTVVDPGNTGFTVAPVAESLKPGLYFFDVLPAFLVTGGVGSYGVSIEVDTFAGPSGPPHVRDADSGVLHVSVDDFDSIATVVNTLKRAKVLAETTVTAGSTASEIRTGLTQADGFFDGARVLVVNSAGAVVRRIDAYALTNGAIRPVDALPFTPSVGDPVLLLGEHSAPDGSAI